MGVSYLCVPKVRKIRLSGDRIERIKKFEKRKGEVEKKGKERVKSIMDEALPSRSRDERPGQSQWRNEILTGRRSGQPRDNKRNPMLESVK